MLREGAAAAPDLRHLAEEGPQISCPIENAHRSLRRREPSRRRWEKANGLPEEGSVTQRPIAEVGGNPTLEPPCARLVGEPGHRVDDLATVQLDRAQDRLRPAVRLLIAAIRECADVGGRWQQVRREPTRWRIA